MNSFILIEATTGTPIHFAAYRPDFGLPLEQAAEPRLVAMSMSNLISTLRIRAADVFGEGGPSEGAPTGFEGFASDSLQTQMHDDPENNILCIVATHPAVPADVAAGLARRLSELFVRDHAAAIPKAASGRTQSHKKAFRPVLYKLLWDLAGEVAQPLASQLADCCGAPWVLAAHSPELAAAAARAQQRKRVAPPPSDAELLSITADLRGASVVVCPPRASGAAAAPCGAPPLFLAGKPPDDSGPDGRRASLVHQGRVMQLMLCALRLQGAGQRALPRRATLRLGRAGELAVLVLGDLFLAFPVARGSPADLAAELLPEESVALCVVWLRFLHDHSVRHPDDPPQVKAQARRQQPAPANTA
eukprot:TRINITY_DN8954_c0_g1_i1.p1 TRINITY_DN8954_c0_g1~~TRINITY_DN8954_c0_g1_i1.p1  ORF type:complete len:361 (+),score=102.20 TRINITY_DN8954_c0_g1_i1:82-1164(+)